MRAKRKDENHNDIQAHLLAHGWACHDTSGLGWGFPDILVSKPGFTVCVEVKDGSKPPSERKLTPAEQRFKDNWTGPYVIALSPDDALLQLDALHSQWGRT